MQKWIILIIVCLILILGIFIISNVSIETEYTPETEIEEVELRKTIVTLYFKDRNSGEVVKETQLIDSKILLNEPYKELVNLLIKGPQNSNNERLIPENTQILDCSFENGCVTINFSKELENENMDQATREKIYTTLYNTLKELREVNHVKILIENEQKQEYLDIESQYFVEDNNSENEISENMVSQNIVQNTL